MGPAVGAVIGYITNDIAIRMLFRPHQAKYIFDKLVTLLEKNGIKKEEVVKVNIWTTDVSKNMDITKAYSEYFMATRPACSWIGVAALNRPSQIVEIEMIAMKGCIFKD